MSHTRYWAEHANPRVVQPLILVAQKAGVSVRQVNIIVAVLPRVMKELGAIRPSEFCSLLQGMAAGDQNTVKASTTCACVTEILTGLDMIKFSSEGLVTVVSNPVLVEDEEQVWSHAGPEAHQKVKDCLADFRKFISDGGTESIDEEAALKLLQDTITARIAKGEM